MELYTSLTRLKMAMNGGQLPPMTPIPVDAQKYIDPALTIGMGALMEDENKGLRCPVRGCGEWHHSLTTHLNSRHRGIGGATAVREHLSLPRNVPLSSTRMRFVRKKATSRSWMSTATATAKSIRDRAREKSNHPEGRRKSAMTRIANAQSVGLANLRDQCVAQLSHKLIDLEHRLNRSPSDSDVVRAYGYPVRDAIIRTFGSFNAAKSQCGLSIYKRGITKEDVYCSLKEYYRINHRLPTTGELKSATRTPLIPHVQTILRVLGVSSWPIAMAHVAFVLGIEDVRYREKVPA